MQSATFAVGNFLKCHSYNEGVRSSNDKFERMLSSFDFIGQNCLQRKFGTTLSVKKSDTHNLILSKV